MKSSIVTVALAAFFTAAAAAGAQEIVTLPTRDGATQSFLLTAPADGKSATSGPCEPFSAHGYLGKETETVDAIVNWMLKKPFAREIN